MNVVWVIEWYDDESEALVDELVLRPNEVIGMYPIEIPRGQSAYVSMRTEDD